MKKLSDKFLSLAKLCATAEVIGDIKSRKREIVYAKAHFSVYMYKNTDLSFREIGSCLGIDHSTVQRNIRVHEERMQFPDYCMLYRLTSDSLDHVGFSNPKNQRYKCV